MHHARLAEHAAACRKLIAAALDAADPARAVRGARALAGFRHETPPIALLGVGKASLPMMRAAREVVGDNIGHSFATTLPQHAADPFWKSLPGPVFACDHPLPTPRNVMASHELVRWVSHLPPLAPLVVMLSGGASAHLCLPREGVTLEDLIAATRHLQQGGADIHDLNCIRRHCERLKGGGLAKLAQPRRVESFVLSDVIGDPLHDISSGPSVPDPTTFAQAAAIADRYKLASIAPSVARCIHAGARAEFPENPRLPTDFHTPPMAHVIAGNRHVLNQLVRTLDGQGFASTKTCFDQEGSADHVASQLVAAVHSAAAARLSPQFAVLVGGEWTVDTKGTKGTGGPSQELALRLAQSLQLKLPWTALTLSTDGRDGPTDAAGAMVNADTAAHANRLGLDVASALARHDSHTALAALNALIHTGPTGTNLNHLAVILVG